MTCMTIGDFAASLRGEKLDKNEIRGLILGFEDTPEIWEKDRVVRSWIKDMGDFKNAERYLTKVENESTTIYDLAVCATLWTECFSNKDRASKCLIEAQKLAKTPSDWLDCHSMWIELLPEETDNVKQCLSMADTLSTSE